jgi:hypothetical protein
VRLSRRQQDVISGADALRLVPIKNQTAPARNDKVVLSLCGM